jgi:hypothetical protein
MSNIKKADSYTLTNFSNLSVARDFLLDKFKVASEKELPAPVKGQISAIKNLSPQFHCLIQLIVPHKKIITRSRDYRFFSRRYNTVFAYNTLVIHEFFDFLGLDKSKLIDHIDIKE